MRETEPSDRVLWARACLGDANAFASLVSRYSRPALAIALAILANRSDAEDVCQDAWVRALERMDGCRDPDKFAAWLFQVVRNRARNYLEYRRVRVAEPLDAVFGVEGPPEARSTGPGSEQAHRRVALERALTKLAEPDREVLLLHDLAGLRHRAIAESLGISEVLSRKRLFQARARMRQLLGDSALGRS